MARAKENAGTGAIASLIAITLFLPFILVSVVKYFLLKNRFVNNRNIIRIIDINRAFSRLVPGIAIIALIVIGIYFLHPIYMERHYSPETLKATIAIISLVYILTAWRTASAFASGLIGVIVDADDAALKFPTDGVLRSFSLKVVMDAIIPSSIEIIPLEEIHGYNRQAGKTLIIHGDFGSRAITFSDKLRRDQLLSCITGYRRFSDVEFSGEGDYA